MRNVTEQRAGAGQQPPWAGHPDRETLERLANDGYPFIQKPFTGEELTRFIDRVLDARST